MNELLGKLLKVDLNNVCEARFMDVKRKQRTISWLFPTFNDRVQGVQDLGGIRLKSVGADSWKFKVHSGTKERVWYDVVLGFLDVRKTLGTLVRNRKLWTVGKKKVDLRKLASKFMEQVNVQLLCSCPADLYYGGHYIRSLPRYNAKYGEPERRPPRKRNRHQYGMLCKHGSALMKALPFYTQTAAKWLNDFYGDDIREMEDEVRGESEKFKAAAGELRKRREQQPEPEEEKPEPKLRVPRLPGVRPGKTRLAKELLTGKKE